jgi:hypothetical protein
MLKQSLILGEKAEKEQQTKVKRIKLDGDTSLKNGMVAIAYNYPIAAILRDIFMDIIRTCRRL